MAGLIEVDDIDWQAYMADTDVAQRVRPASAWREPTRAYLRGDRSVTGATLPWSKTHDRIRLRPGEVTVWAGYNGAGKSLMLGQVVLGFMAVGERALIASFEMLPHVTLARMTRQATMGDRPTDLAIDGFHAWTDGKLWLYDHQGQVAAAQVLAVCRFAAAELGAQHVVIDSLMKAVRGEDDYNGQKDFVDALCGIARTTGMHVHLVHHMRKGESESKLPGKHDLKGSGSISDQVDNVAIVWRNKAKQSAVQDGENIDPEKPDALLIIDKQRNGEYEGRVALWFDPASQQFLGSSAARPIDVMGQLAF